MIASDKFNDSPACSEFVIVDGHGNELTVAQLEAVEWTPLEELAVTEEPDREQISDWMLAVDEKVCLLPCAALPPLHAPASPRASPPFVSSQVELLEGQVAEIAEFVLELKAKNEAKAKAHAVLAN